MQTEGERSRETAGGVQGTQPGLFLWGLIGFLVGGALQKDVFGIAAGSAIGVLWGAWRRAHGQSRALADQLRTLDARLRALESASMAPFVGLDPAESTHVRSAAPAPADGGLVSDAEGLPSGATPAPDRITRPASTAAAAGVRSRVTPSGPGVVDRVASSLRGVLFGGNTVVRVGVLVLLVGLTVLAKWAVDNALFPVEARLATASLIGLALVVVGYRLRDARPGFATTLQGGGIAALYMVVFFALHIFNFVPVPLAFALFVAIAVSCGLLAVVQGSQALIFIGSLGGFLAPILASAGGGNHVALFGYYLLLNVAIAGVAWRQSWRALNVLAFVATYGVATAWGVLRYEPENFATTEPFLLAYMVLFTLMAVLFATRQSPRLTGVVDGTLVFGTPLVTLLAQAHLVRGMDFGMAYSTVGFAIFYALVATWVWRRSPDTLRRMAEAFLALAVGFATVAIPLGLDDGLTTTLVWAVEGAGLYWVGTRQDRRLPRYAGIALQALAAAAFYWSTEVGSRLGGFRLRADAFWALANAHFMACLALALAGFFIARESFAARQRTGRGEWEATQGLAAWALLWWSGGFLVEIDRFVDNDYQVTAVLVLIGASGIALEGAARRLDWLPGRLLAMAAIPAAFAAVALSAVEQSHLLANAGWLAWPLLLAAIYALLRYLEDCDVVWVRKAYAPALWLVAVVISLSLHGVADDVLKLSIDWKTASGGVGLAVVLLAANRAVREEVGVFGRHAALHAWLGMGPVAALALLWSLAINSTARGAAAPLPYVPLLNPADVSLVLIAIAVATWLSLLGRVRPKGAEGPWRQLVGPVLAGLAFVWLNGVLVRTVHQWSDVAFRAGALWRSAPLQVSISIAWTLVALGGMVLSTRNGWRTRWVGFATLLGVVVVKLFTVDLSQLSTGAKIGTFLVVGILLLVIGYFSPVPPEVEGGGDDTALAGADRRQSR
jgi:uncharacterized membrane protein